MSLVTRTSHFIIVKFQMTEPLTKVCLKTKSKITFDRECTREEIEKFPNRGGGESTNGIACLRQLESSSGGFESWRVLATLLLTSRELCDVAECMDYAKALAAGPDDCLPVHPSSVDKGSVSTFNPSHLGQTALQRCGLETFASEDPDESEASDAAFNALPSGLTVTMAIILISLL